jgi:hypothetical protein
MGVAHLLDEPGSASELAALGQARPLLRDDRLLLFGYTDYRGAEQDVLVRRVLLHLDVDVVDFIDPPIADIPQHNAGLTFDEAMTCLAVFARHEGLAGLIITEFNPDHGAEDGSTADALVRGLVGALTGDAIRADHLLHSAPVADGLPHGFPRRASRSGRRVRRRAGRARREWRARGRVRRGPARRHRPPRCAPAGRCRRTGP